MKLTKNFIIILILLFVAVVSFVAKHFYDRYENSKLIVNDDIHIVYTADVNYKDYTKVSIKSAILNKAPKSKYHINILCVDLTDAQMKEFEAMKAENAEVTAIPLKLSSIENIGNYKVSNPYVTRADLFKFLMPELFPNLDKILYIDSDTIIKGDLANLYNINLSGKYIGAVKRYDGMLWKHIFLDLYWAKYHYNCGVLLFNLEQWRKGNITQKLIEAKEEDYLRRYVSQGAFNEVLPLKTIKQISPIYNMVSRITPADYYGWNLKRHYAPFLNDCQTVDDFYRKSVIVHYAGPVKPWHSPESYQAYIWWEYAKMVNPNWKVEKLGN